MKSLQQAVTEGRIIELPGNDKTESLALLSAHIETALNLRTKTPVIDKVLEREAHANTYLAYGIACPHARPSGGGELVCAIGWSKTGIAYGNPDGTPVRLFFLYYIPDSANKAYLDEISSIARVLEKSEKNRAIEELKDITDVHTFLLKWADTLSSFPAEEFRQPFFTGSKSTLGNLVLPEVLELMESGRLGELRDFLSSQPAPETAELINALHDEHRILLFRLLPRHLADEVFCLLDPLSQETLLENMAQEDSRRILAALAPDDRTTLFEELPARVTQQLLGLLNDNDRKQALTLLSYPENSVGRLMTNRYVTIKAEWTVAQALEHIRKVGTDSETLVMVYITDENGKLKDDIRLRKILLASLSTPVASLLDGTFACLYSFQEREEAIQVFRKYDLYALPVVDSDGILLGIVTVDDILDVAEEEATVDIHKGSAIHPLNTGYLQAPLSVLYSRRIVWLLILVVINIFTGLSIAHFEELIESVIALVFFLPLLIGSAGNAGAQSATLVIRSMALGQLKIGDYLKAVLREGIVSLGLGTSMAAAVFLLAWWRSGIRIGMITALAMTIVVWASSLIGMSLPFILRRLKMDPAVASGPLVMSIVDIMGILIYFGLASAIIGSIGV